MRQRFSAEQWTRWFDEFGSSGLTVKEFCRRKQVCQNSFYQWRKKLNPPTGAIESSLFVPVALPASGRVEIEMPCGAVIRVPSDPNDLQPVLEALLRIPESRK